MAEALLVSRKDVVKFTAMNGNYLSLVNTQIKPCLLHWTMVEYLPYSNFQIANKGVFKHTSENADSATKEEIDYLLEKERNTAQYYTNRLIEFLTFNAPSKFSEYYTNNNEDVYPDKDVFSGWLL